MLSYISASIHKALIGLVHLWVAHIWLDKKTLPGQAMFFVYPENMEWGEEILKGKRIRVTFEVEDWKP